jgi:hypothetical protein
MGYRGTSVSLLAIGVMLLTACDKDTPTRYEICNANGECMVTARFRYAEDCEKFRVLDANGVPLRLSSSHCR